MSNELIKGMSRKEYERKRYLTNRDKNKEYYQLQHKEYYQLHRVEILAKHKEYREHNRELLSSKNRAWQKKSNLKQKSIALIHYGNGKLACIKCGFDDIRVLSIDHVNGGGSAHIRSISGGYRAGHIYAWLIKNHLPEGYQTLCMNCQWIKRNENHE